VTARAWIRVLLLGAVGLIGFAVWISGAAQRSAADGAFAEMSAAESMVVSLLEEEEELRTVASDPGARERVRQARSDFEHALVRAQMAVGSDEKGVARLLGVQARLGSEFHVLADRFSAEALSDPSASAGAALSLLGHQLGEVVERFRVGHDELRAALNDERLRDQRRAGFVPIGVIVAITLAGGLVLWLNERGGRAERRRRARAGDFADALQVARTEGEAYGLLKRQLERSVEAASAVVLNRNNSEHRLEARTEVPEGSPLTETLATASPESCLAIRIGKPFRRQKGHETLVGCEVCGCLGESVTCVPSLVGGRVIGSVLVQHRLPLGATAEEQIREAVAAAAPVIANLRTLALAETRAATDALTGLPNHRSVQETLKRMVAQAQRTMTPLAAILFDLDHFKEINDRYGHDRGDEVLAAAGAAVNGSLRASDFVGRYGGEEFLALLPNTSRADAVAVAEKLRHAISTITVRGIDRDLTASLGVAVLPEEANDSTELLRNADRALYTAKARGRNRIETLTDLPGGARPLSESWPTA
jgi:diguanylate cyclase (GGDEF)-like protein